MAKLNENELEEWEIAFKASSTKLNSSKPKAKLMSDRSSNTNQVQP